MLNPFAPSFSSSIFKDSNERILLCGQITSKLKHYVYIWEIQKIQNRDLKTKHVIDQKYP